MAPTHHLLLILLLLVALHARAARTAPWKAWGTDEAGGNGYKASQLNGDWESLGHPGAVPVGAGDAAWQLGSRTATAGDGTDVPDGRTFPAPQLDPAQESGWHPTGPPRAKYPAEGGENSREASEVMKHVLEELERTQETDPEAVQESAFPGGSSGSRLASASAREAMQAPRMPVLSRFGEHHRSKVYEFHPTDSGAVGKKRPSMSRPHNIASVLCPQDVRKGCMIGTVVIVIFVPLALLLCYVIVQQRSKSKDHAYAAWVQRLETGR
ncbi:uncharacterized protein LOC116962373 [Tyto alba]|uniref:uncharacterized protein LOC116962373 n=1 Tax=Tyto alba TaxID=56313 RepID=UPI001C668DCE|nr:uncharacterized protein LOC116962373 [Tyto alba]